MARIPNINSSGYANLSGHGSLDVKKFGAKGDGSTDDTAAITAAITECHNAAGGGFVVFPPGTYVHTGLVIPEWVSLQGCPDTTFLATNHATANSIVFTGYQQGPPVTISDIRFISLVSNTGHAVNNTSDARAQFIRCSWNGFDSGGGASNNLKGTLGRAGSSDATLEYIDCRIEVAGTLDGLSVFNGATLKVRGGVIKMPAVYSSSLVLVNSNATADLETLFDCTGHTNNPSGHGRCVYTIDASTRIRINSTINVTGAAATVDGAGWAVGTRVDILCLDVVGNNIVRYFTNSLAAKGSRIDMAVATAQSVTGTSLSCETGVAGKSFYQTAGGSPTITLPAILFEGQEFDLTYFQTTGGSLGVSISGYGVKATQPTVTNNTGITARFRAMDHHAITVPTWTQIGPWGAVTL